MRFHGRNRVGKGCSVLNLQPADGVRIIAAPDLRLIVKHSGVKPPAAAAAPAEQDIRVREDNLIHQVIKAQNITVVNLPLLFLLLNRGPGFCDETVHIPFHILNLRFIQNRINGRNNIITYVFS